MLVTIQSKTAEYKWDIKSKGKRIKGKIDVKTLKINEAYKNGKNTDIPFTQTVM